MALAFTWEGYAETDLGFNEFFTADHTVAVRFMLQYPNAYRGPMLSTTGSRYVLGQGDYSEALGGGGNIVFEAGTAKLNAPHNFQAGTWHHAAVVRSGNMFTLYLDSINVGSITKTGSNPSGRLRMGRGWFDATKDNGGEQFYGLLDDVAVFTKALSANEIKQLAQAHHLTGTEDKLLAGYTFGYTPPGSPATLSRPVQRTPAAMIRNTSATRADAADAKLLPLALTEHLNLPFPRGQAMDVIQGVDSQGAGDSHKGYAAFCWDFILAGKNQSSSNGIPFHSAGFGKVDFVRENEDGPALSNVVTIQHAGHELADYLHLVKNSAVVSAGKSVGVGDHLADVGDTGVKKGAYHLHFATTNLGERRKSEGAFVTIPAPFSNYEESDDQGKTWRHVVRGIPRRGQWVRRPVLGPVRYTAVWRRSNESEIQVYGWTYSSYRKKYDELWKQGWRLKLIQPYVINGQVRYTAVWRPSTEGEIQVYGWTYSSYRKKYDELWKQGWRLKLIQPYVINGQVRYTAAWSKSTKAEVQVYGWEYGDCRGRYDVLWAHGWRLEFLLPYTV